MAATPWATNRAGGTKADFNRKIFGGTVGGPIAKNKLFFFGDYQGGRQKSPPADAFVTVIPDEWRRGDLSSLLNRRDADRRPRSADRPAVPEQPDPGRAASATFARNLLANEALYPRANVTAGAQRLPPELPRQGGVLAEGRTSSTRKVDWNASTNDKVYVRYSKQTHESHAGSDSDAAASSRSLRENPFWSVGANWNRIIGTTLVNDLLVGFNDNSFNGTPLDLNGVGALNNQLGIGGAQPIPGLTEVRMGNDLTNIGTIAIGSNTANQVFQINERLTWVKGRHQLKFGGSWNHYNDGALLLGQQRPARVHRSYNGALHRAWRSPTSCSIRSQSKGRGSLTVAVDAPAEPRRRSTPPTTSRPPTP